jgi:hypothetical protein
MSRSAILLAGLLLLTSSAHAAPVPKGPKAPDEPVPTAAAKLLKYRKVQKELKMSAEQRINLYDALEDIEEEFEKRLLALDKLPNAPDQAYDKLDKDRLASVEKLVKTTADKELNAAQRARLRQIDRQVRGPGAFAEPAVQKALQLTDDQKKAAAELAERAAAQAERYLDELGGDDEDKVKADAIAFRKDSAKQFAAALTADQRDLWKSLLGEPVKGFDADELWLRVVEDEDLEPQ